MRLLPEITAMGDTNGIDTVRRFVRSLQAYRRAKTTMTVRFDDQTFK